MINKLAAFFQRPKENTQHETPEGVCPNCWGQQRYGDQIREMYEDKQIDVNNNSANYAFIQNFVIKHIDGIRLKKGIKVTECPTCKMVA